MNYSKNIVEENLKDAMEYFQSIENNYLSTFKKVTNDLKQQEYHSIQSNYVALFLHQMIKNKVSINSFNEVIQYIYNSDINIEHSLHRFFGGSCCDISLTKYWELQKPGISDKEKKYSIWSEMSYFFYDIKNESYGLNKEYIPYLESMVKLMPEKRLNELYSSGFIIFLSLVVNNPDDLAPIFKVIQSNDAYESYIPSFPDSIINKHKPFFYSFIGSLSNESYKMSEEEKTKIYNSFCKSIENCEEVFLNKVLTYYPKDKYHKFNFDLGMGNFLNTIGSDKVFSKIDKKYKEIIDKEKLAHSHRKNPYDIELDVASEISTSLQISFEKKNFEIDYNIIDIQKPFLENFVYIKLLDIQLMSGKKPLVLNNIREYILKEFKIDDSGSWPELDDLIHKKEMTKYFEYLDIAEELITNPSKSIKIKI